MASALWPAFPCRPCTLWATFRVLRYASQHGATSPVTATPTTLAGLDASRRAALSRLLQDPSPFYGDRLAAAGVTDARELPRLPLSRRVDLLRDQLAHLPHGTRRSAAATAPVRVGIAGSGERLLVLAWSAAELSRERRAGTRLLGGLGVRAGMRVANTLPGALATPGALLLGDVIEELGGLDVPLGVVDGPAAARQAWELLERVQPEVIVCDQGSASHLFASAPPPSWCRGLVWLRSAIAPEVSPSPPAFSGWQRTWLAVPEATSFVAGSCARERLHVDDEVLAEVVDEATGAQAAPGEAGVLALTPLGSETRLLRYATGIRVRQPDGACPCGAPGPTLEVA